jgi:hypothetical protein
MQYYPRLIALEGKHPAEVVDYALACAEWLADAETLSSVAVTVAAGLTLTPAGTTAPAISGTNVVFWVGGGSNSQTYNVQVTLTTSGGRTLVVDAAIAVTDPTP